MTVKQILNRCEFYSSPTPTDYKSMPMSDIVKFNKTLSEVNVKIGYGFTKLTKAEATLVARHRIEIIWQDLAIRFHFFYRLPEKVQWCLVELCFHFGVERVCAIDSFVESLSLYSFKFTSESLLSSSLCRENQRLVEDIALTIDTYSEV